MTKKTDKKITEVVVVVSCVKQKKEDDQLHEARDLYTSDWFTKARYYAENEGDRWMILSALHGLIKPETKIAAYNVSVSSSAGKNRLPAKERREWAERCAAQIKDQDPEVIVAAVGVRFVVLAGLEYRKPFDLAGVEYSVPMKGLGVGEQKGWLKSYALQAKKSRRYNRQR